MCYVYSFGLNKYSQFRDRIPGRCVRQKCTRIHGCVLWRELIIYVSACLCIFLTDISSQESFILINMLYLSKLIKFEAV